MNEGGFTTLAGYYYQILCTCREVIEEGPRPTAEAARIAASTSWNLHLRGA